MKKLTKYFFNGLAFLVPIMATIYVVYAVFMKIDNLFDFQDAFIIGGFSLTHGRNPTVKFFDGLLYHATGCRASFARSNCHGNRSCCVGHRQSVRRLGYQIAC